ncbi:hypothetical protein IQ235_16730 [Oscillatoriales cyanobacterium LEGE 11467]|uniref:PEP-CTERM sorting domain-containing protein n=1 Tax=Zarconia navalis LEGE 11467 TaxID=1828826 RepID=A0A928W1X8_9CYAN|nr:hypothetical protein [Zarconia navalis]MBE9042418.1 hypothetical protein [Zarconia navalis LEGE 11467]
MKLQQKLTKGLFLLAAPIFAGSTFNVTPTLAATFASSSSTANLFNFSQTPLSGSLSVDADAQGMSLDGFDPGSMVDDGDSVSSNAGSGSIFASADVSAALIFDDDPAEAFNSTLSIVGGDSREYIFSAQSDAEVVGNFFLDTASLFSFEFVVSSLLDTEIDNPLSETVSASANISFAIFGGTSQSNQTLLDTFSLSAFLQSQGPDVGTTLQQSSNNFNLTEFEAIEDFGDSQLEESITFFAGGSYQRNFDANSYITVVEVKNNKAAAAVPEPFEPSIVLSLLLTGGAIGMRSKLKSQKV